MVSAPQPTNSELTETAGFELTAIQLRAFLADRATLPVTAVAGGAGQRRLTVVVEGPTPFRATVEAAVADPRGVAIVHGELPIGTEVSAARTVHDWCRELAVRLEAAGAHWPIEQRQPRREALTLAQAAGLSRELGSDAAEQWPLLAQWAQLVADRTGHAPRWWRQDDPGPALLLSVPQLPQELRSDLHLLLRLGEGLGDGAVLPMWVAALGFGVDAAGLLDTVPTPASFCALVQQTLGRPPAFAPVLQPNNWFVAWERPWLHAMCQGQALINVPRPAIGRAIGPQLWRLGARALPGVRGALHALSVVPGHDLTLHCLPQHRIPAADVEKLCGPIRAALSRCPGPAAPDSLARFFENDLTRHCQSIWRECHSAADFDVVWQQRWPEILAARDCRLLHAAKLGRLGGWVPMQQWLPGGG